jgi:hypothetical protein
MDGFERAESAYETTPAAQRNRARAAPISASARILRRKGFLMSPPLRDELSRLVIALFPFLWFWVRLFKFELVVTASAAPASNWLFLCINCPEDRAELRNDPHDALLNRGLFFAYAEPARQLY